MFEELEIKILTKSGSLPLKTYMQKSILHIAKILQPPSVTNIATYTRLIASDTRNELKEWIESNKEHFLKERKLFHEFLHCIQSLQSRISHLAQ